MIVAMLFPISGQSQRNSALQLASLMVCQLGVPWALGPHGSDKKLLLLIINLACVEVRMSLEDNTLVSNKTNKFNELVSLIVFSSDFCHRYNFRKVLFIYD